MSGRQHVRGLALVTAIVALVGASLFGMSRNAVAQDATPVPGGGASTVSVTGHGMVTVTPDAASISVGVNVINATLSEAQAQATTQMTAVIDALKAAGIDEKDIQTSNYSVNVIQEYDTNGYPARVSGYQVSNQVNVMVRDLSKLGDLLDAAVKAGANSIYGVNFIVSDPSKASTQARAAAVEDATKRAEEIASATGMKLGRVVSANESYGPSPLPMYAGAGMAMDKAAVPIQSGGNVISIDVQMTFEMVP